MADSLPDGGDFFRATFEQVLSALTGFTTDLRKPLTDAGGGADGGSHGWFTMANAKDDAAMAAATATSYHAWGKYYFAINYNQTAYDAWTKALKEVDDLIPQLQAAKLGLMDVNLLWNAKGAVDQYVNWLDHNEQALRSWIKTLDSPDSAFRGRAAYVIQQNLERLAFSLKDLREQIATRRTPNLSAKLKELADTLTDVASKLAQTWHDHRAGLGSAVTEASAFITDAIYRYLAGIGLIVGQPNYNLDIFWQNIKKSGRSADAAQPDIEKFINEALANFSSETKTGRSLAITGDSHYGNTTGGRPEGTFSWTPATPPDGFPQIKGDLRNQATWDDFNAKIRDFAIMRLSPVDADARAQLKILGDKYESAKLSLGKVLENKWPTLGSPPPSGDGSGGTGGPGGNGDFHIPPPGGDGGSGNGDENYHLPDGGAGNGNANYNPPFGGGNGDQNYNLPNGGAGNGNENYNPPFGGGNGDNFNPPGGDGSGSGGNDLAPPPDGGLGPLALGPNGLGSPTASNSPNGTARNFRLPPGEDAFEPPSGGGQNGNSSEEGWAPPGSGGNFQLPPLTQTAPGAGPPGQANFHLPPDLDASSPGAGGHANFSLPPGHDGAGLPGPAGGANFGAPPGSGAPGESAFGASGAGGGSGGALGGSGEGWADWSGDLGAGGAHQGAGLGANPVNGMPMMPPMIPPMMGGMGGLGGMGGAGGAKERERERQTWLSEDEKVWGTDSAAGSGVIGRPDDERVADEPLAHRHVHVRTAASRGKATEKQVEAGESAETTGTA